MNRFFYEPKNKFRYKKIDTSFENKMNKKNVEILQVLTDEKTKDRKCLRIISLTE